MVCFVETSNKGRFEQIAANLTDKRRKRSYSSYKKKQQILLPLMIAGDKRRDQGRMTGSSFGKKKVTRFDHTVVLWA